MAKVVYIINKKSNRTGKSLFNFDGNANGKGRWFERLFHKSGEDKLAEEPNEFSVESLLSKLNSTFDGSSNRESEQRIEFEGSVEDIKAMGEWSIGEIKANAESLKNASGIIKDYCKAISATAKECYNMINETDKIEAKANKLEAENNKLEAENDMLKHKLAEKDSKKTADEKAADKGFEQL